MSLAPPTFPRGSFNDDLLATVVEHLVHGESWEEAAKAIEWDVAELKRVCRNDPNYNAAYEYAKRERDREDEARVRRKLREGLNNPDPKQAQKAAEFLAKEISAERRDQTRLEVERLRAESRQVSAQARMMRASAQPAPEDDWRESPEVERQRQENWNNSQKIRGDVICRENHPVFLWKGCHKIGETPPDETDVPLYLIADDTVKGRVIYWAFTTTPPTDIYHGPFLPPPGIAV